MRKKIELNYSDGTCGSAELEHLRPLGQGLLSDVYLARDNASGKMYAEKVFRREGSAGAAMTSGLYRLFFQAPPPYQTSEDAARAALYRRNVAKDVSMFRFGYPAVSGGLYTRWDEDFKSNVLGTEYVQGRPPLRGEANRELFRQLTNNSIGRLYCSLKGSDFCRMEGPRWEIDELKKHMKSMGKMFRESGFVGSEWQVDPLVSVTSRNFLRTDDGKWVLVDMESGVPAIAHPKYIWKGIASGHFPLYDDVDSELLENYLAENEAGISERFGSEFMDRLYANADKLVYHTGKWKGSEAAIFRNKHKIFTDPEMRREARKRWAEHWRKGGEIDNKLASEIEQSDLSCLKHFSYDTVASALSGLGYTWDSMAEITEKYYKIAKGAPRILYSAFFDEEYLEKKTEEYIDREVEKWLDRGWISPEESAIIGSQVKSDKWLKEHVRGTVAYIDLKILDPPILGDLIWEPLPLIQETCNG